MAAASQLGYQPNLLARGLMTGQTRLIALVMAQLRNPFFTDMLGLFNHHFQACGYQTLLLAVDGEHSVDEVLESVLKYQPDGAVLVSCTPSLTMAQRCVHDGMPLVIIDRSLDAAIDELVTHVWIRSERLGREIAKCLLAEGRQRVALLEGYAEAPLSELARFFMQRMLGAEGVSVQVEHGQYSYEGGYAAGLRLLRSASPPDAVYCIADPMALGVIDAARMEFGLRVPEDLSVVGFSDIPAAAWRSHALTTAQLPIAELVEHAAEALLERLESPETPAKTVLLDCPLIRRGTTLPPT